MTPQRKVVVYNPARFTGEAWLPVLWAQAKTYYERHGTKCQHWHWASCELDLYGEDFERTKQLLEEIQPNVFAASLYVWNYQIVHRVCEWVKQRWPNCLVITGGPHQYFKHNDDWFIRHPYIDASLPGECYGELAFLEILDNLDDQGRMDWNRVADICYPVGKTRFANYSSKTTTARSKKDFDYSWSAVHSQLPALKEFVDYARNTFDRCKVLSIFETTRGCPYGCTYCDWGGGINTSVLKRPVKAVELDIRALCELDLNYLYFADANFGIFGERDVEIINLVARYRRQRRQSFTVGYGGFAKTENRLNYIREILKVDIKNNLSALGEIKISMQSLDEDVLHRIDRKNVSLDQQIEVLQSLSSLKKLPLYVELIHGLPGMTLKKFYHEFDVLGTKRLSVQWYPWILLPEAPAYSRQYRQEQQLTTVIKTVGWWWAENANNYNEIVVGSSTYTTDDYLEMVLASGFYKLFVQGGYLNNTLCWLEQNNVQLGKLIQDMFQEFLPNTHWLTLAQQHWNNRVLLDTNAGCFIDYQDQQIYLGLYFVAVAFMDRSFNEQLVRWISQRYYCPDLLTQQDLELLIDHTNLDTVDRTGLWFVDRNKKGFKNTTKLDNVLLQFVQFKNSGHIVRAKKKFLGLI